VDGPNHPGSGFKTDVAWETVSEKFLKDYNDHLGKVDSNKIVKSGAET
jgi:hypothetical protein